MTNKDYIEKACQQFKSLMEEQLERQERMETGSAPKDFAAMEKITIGIVGGDGIGPIIMEQAERLLRVSLAEEISAGRIVLKQIEGLTIENRTALGKAVPDDVLAAIKECDVLLKGPTTTPKGGTLESANVTLRRELDLYANVRPVQVPEEGIDWIFYRENTEGEYVLGSRGVEIPGKLSMDFKVTTEAGTRRIAKAAFDYAAANGKDNVAIVTKANIMKKTDGNFTRSVTSGGGLPGNQSRRLVHRHHDGNLVNKDYRSSFQVFVLPNLYGDIITDEAAEIPGRCGNCPAAPTWAISTPCSKLSTAARPV